MKRSLCSRCIRGDADLVYRGRRTHLVTISSPRLIHTRLPWPRGALTAMKCRSPDDTVAKPPVSCRSLILPALTLLLLFPFETIASRGVIRNVSIVGWGKPPDTSPNVAHPTSGRASVAMMDAGVAAAAAGSTTPAVLSCQGRHSQDESGSAMRGLWLMEGRITRLANLTVTGGAARRIGCVFLVVASAGRCHNDGVGRGGWTDSRTKMIVERFWGER